MSMTNKEATNLFERMSGQSNNCPRPRKKEKGGNPQS